MDDEEDIRPLNPSQPPVIKAEGSLRKTALACTATGVMITLTLIILITQPRSPDMDLYAAMDWTVDPCQDFYHYACGTWINTTTLPPERSQYMRSFSAASERNMAKVTDIVLRDTELPYSAVGNYYKACMDIDAVNTLGAAPVQPFLNFTITSWPQAMNQAAQLQRAGFDMFWSFDVEPDEMNNTINMFQLDQGGLILPQNIYVQGANDTIATLSVYTKHIAGMFVLAGVTQSPETAAVMAAQAVAFETSIARCQIDQHLLLDPRLQYNPTTMANVEKTYPGIPFQTWLQAVSPENVPNTVNVVVPAFFANFSALITSNDTSMQLANVQAYMKWHVINAAAIHLSMDFVNAHFDFFGRYLNGAQQLPPRQTVCVERTHASLTDLVVQQFLAENYDPSTVQTAHDMVSQLINAFRNRLQTIDWMDAATKANATIKLNAIVPMVAGPSTQELRNYSTVDVEANDLFGNWIRINKNDLLRDMEKLTQTPDRLKWHMAADEVNAYYDPSTNTIVFPIGILEPTFFIQGASPSLNFGGVGCVIGHEMTHGFDNQGRLFDAQGNLRDWWSPQSALNFQNRTACVVNYYTALGGDGTMSLTENLADMGGVKTGYEGYKAAEKAQSNGLPIQAPLTPDQKFFVAYAQNWCAVMTPEAEHMQILTDVHSLPQFRVQGPLANYDEFAKAFKCPFNSTYNPPTRCSVW